MKRLVLSAHAPPVTGAEPTHLGQTLRSTGRGVDERGRRLVGVERLGIGLGLGLGLGLGRGLRTNAVAAWLGLCGSYAPGPG